MDTSKQINNVNQKESKTLNQTKNKDKPILFPRPESPINKKNERFFTFITWEKTK